MDHHQDRVDHRRHRDRWLHAALVHRSNPRCAALVSVLGQPPTGLDNHRLDHRFDHGFAQPTPRRQRTLIAP